VSWRATQSGPPYTGAATVPPSYRTIHLTDVIPMQWRAVRVVAECHRIGLLALLAPLLDGASTQPVDAPFGAGGTCGRRGGTARGRSNPCSEAFHTEMSAGAPRVAVPQPSRGTAGRGRMG
jgi:hypothetical protein